MIAPNKQNLLLLKKQAKTIVNGYKLLKEKRTGLILTFLDLARQGQALEKQLSKMLEEALRKYEQSLTFVSSQTLLSELDHVPAYALTTSKKRISGVYVDSLDLVVQSPVRTSLKPDIQDSLDQFGGYLPVLLQISQIKLNCQKIAREILKTNRQIANLEQKTIEIESQIKFINNTLNEKTNLEKATLIRIFG